MAFEKLVMKHEEKRKVEGITVILGGGMRRWKKQYDQRRVTYKKIGVNRSGKNKPKYSIRI